MKADDRWDVSYALWGQKTTQLPPVMQNLEHLGQFSEITGQSKSCLAVKCAWPPHWLPSILLPLSTLASLPPYPPLPPPHRELLPFAPTKLDSLSKALTLPLELVTSPWSTDACTAGRDTMKLFLHRARIIRALVRGEKNQSDCQSINTKTKWRTPFITFQRVHFTN